MTEAFAEAGFRSLVEGASTPIAVMNASGVFVFVNRAFAGLFGEAASVEDFDDLDCAVLLAEETAPDFRESILPLAAGQGFEGHLHFWRRERPGSTMRVRISPLPFGSGFLSLEVQPERRDAGASADSVAPTSAAARSQIPVLPVAERVIVVPVVGALDVERSSQLLRQLLSGISAHRAKAVILDVTGLSTIDQRAADYLVKAIMAARLKGAHTIVSGVSPQTSEALTDIVVAWTDIVTVGDLKTGISRALAYLGVRLEAREGRKQGA
jgi:anti-anti-sigma regulatory factor